MVLSAAQKARLAELNAKLGYVPGVPITLRMRLQARAKLRKFPLRDRETLKTLRRLNV